MIDDEILNLQWTDFDGYPWKWNRSDLALQDIGLSIDGYQAWYHGTAVDPCEQFDLVGRLDRKSKTAIVRRGLLSSLRSPRHTDKLVEQVYRIIQNTCPNCLVFLFFVRGPC